MIENLKSDIESKNEAINTESTRLESNRLDSKREIPINIESNKLETTANVEYKIETATNTESKVDSNEKDSKNNDEVRFDSNGDEIVYEVRYKLSLWDYFLFGVMLFLGIAMVYGGIKKFLSSDLEYQVGGVMILIFGASCILASCHRLFYARKNRFYVTNNGIGFERRKWFRMQRIFFKFGEVGVAMYYLPAPAYYDTANNIFTLYPFNITYKTMALARFRDTNYKYYTFCKVLANIYRDNAIEILAFIRQKTKEALESQGIHITDSELKDKFKHLLYRDI